MHRATKQWDKPHARIYAEWLLLPAWKALKPEAVTLLITVMTMYRPNDGNEFKISDRRAAELARCSRPTAVKALESLISTGWLEIENFGRMTGELNKRAFRYTLTSQPRYPGDQAKMTFLHWRGFSDGKKNNRSRPKSAPEAEKDRANEMRLPIHFADAQAVEITAIPPKIAARSH
ncbi:hypothetical protein ACMDCR_31730 [Labrys okinawensis]|uniref:hypothetical protein n=1 Tax=Labrys okinawensis TaxID=346911 RepID=UPI0039BD4097